MPFGADDLLAQVQAPVGHVGAAGELGRFVDRCVVIEVGDQRLELLGRARLHRHGPWAQNLLGNRRVQRLVLPLQGGVPTLGPLRGHMRMQPPVTLAQLGEQARIGDIGCDTLFSRKQARCQVSSEPANALGRRLRSRCCDRAVGQGLVEVALARELLGKPLDDPRIQSLGGLGGGSDLREDGQPREQLPAAVPRDVVDPRDDSVGSDRQRREQQPMKLVTGRGSENALGKSSVVVALHRPRDHLHIVQRVRLLEVDRVGDDNRKLRRLVGVQRIPELSPRVAQPQGPIEVLGVANALRERAGVGGPRMREEEVANLPERPVHGYEVATRVRRHASAHKALGQRSRPIVVHQHVLLSVDVKRGELDGPGLHEGSVLLSA